MTDSWKCQVHGFNAQSRALFLEHMKMQDHYHEGTGSVCASCGKFLPVFRTKYIDILEPRIDLCEKCERIADIHNIIKEKRKGVFSKLPVGIGTI